MSVLECGHEPTAQEPGSCGTGYGFLADGARLCYSCCAERQATHARQGLPLLAYLVDRDGRLAIATWSGIVLGPVATYSPIRKHGRWQTGGPVSVRAVVGGTHYFGRCAGTGMAINLRPAKVSA